MSAARLVLPIYLLGCRKPSTPNPKPSTLNPTEIPQVNGNKFLGFRIFWAMGGIIHTRLLACTLYRPDIPDGDAEKEQASEIVWRYLTQVLAFYEIDITNFAGATSDGGPDLKRAFDTLARETAAKGLWVWDWCLPHKLHCALVQGLGTNPDIKYCKNKACRGDITKVRNTVRLFHASPTASKVTSTD